MIIGVGPMAVPGAGLARREAYDKGGPEKPARAAARVAPAVQVL